MTEGMRRGQTYCTSLQNRWLGDVLKIAVGVLREVIRCRISQIIHPFRR